MANRALRIDADSKEGFYYNHEQCSGYLWWRKCRTVREDFNFCGDPSLRKSLKDMGFKLKVVD